MSIRKENRENISIKYFKIISTIYCYFHQLIRTFFISFSFKKARILSFMVKISPIFVFRLKFYPYICSVFKV